MIHDRYGRRFGESHPPRSIHCSARSCSAGKWIYLCPSHLHLPGLGDCSSLSHRVSGLFLSPHPSAIRPRMGPHLQTHFRENTTVNASQTLPSPAAPHGVSPAPTPAPAGHPRKQEAGNLIKSLLHTTWDTADSSNRKNFKNFRGEQAA